MAKSKVKTLNHDCVFQSCRFTANVQLFVRYSYLIAESNRGEFSTTNSGGRSAFCVASRIAIIILPMSSESVS